MALSQKDAVIQAVLAELPTFQKYSDNALSLLSASQLENIKIAVMNGILDGSIDYSKDVTAISEVKTYARSLVMNHLKKAKELNGGSTTASSTTTRSSSIKQKSNSSVPKGVEEELLPEYIKDFVTSLV